MRSRRSWAESQLYVFGGIIDHVVELVQVEYIQVEFVQVEFIQVEFIQVEFVPVIIMVSVVETIISALSWKNVSSLSKSCSSSVNSCKTPVSNISPVTTTFSSQETIVCPVREKWVPILSLENDFISYNKFLAPWGLIKR